MPKRAAVYLRVSRADQSSALQADETSEFIIRRQWEQTHSFVDEGLSGASTKRPELRAMMEAARRRVFDVLVVYRADRVFRSLQELLGTIAELAALGVGFVSVTEPFDTTTPTGTLLLQICGAFGEFERAILIERTRAGMAAAKRRGVRIGRPPSDVDAELVKRLRARGRTWRAIATELRASVGKVHKAGCS